LQQVPECRQQPTTLPILSNVCCKARRERCTSPLTDLDVGVRGSFEANVDKVGATTLPGARLFTIIRELHPAKFPSKLMGRTPLRFAGDKAFSKSSACRRRIPAVAKV